MTEHMLRTDEELEEMDAVPECTGISAHWCPRCGDCECPRPDDGWADSLNDPACPLHGRDSDHAESID